MTSFLVSELVFRWMLTAWALLALIVFFVLLLIPAPYGRHVRSGWGPDVPGSLSWMIMELPALVIFDIIFLGTSPHAGAAWRYCVLWNIHYGYRSLVYPWLVRKSGSVPVTITLSGFGFNVINGFLQSASVCYTSARPALQSLTLDAVITAGGLLFLAGFVIHVCSDAQLRHLRKKRGPGYHIPDGGMYHWISCPNYFGELIEWIGWAMLTWSAAGLVFALWTAANLIPRALSSHKWYHDRFANYPATRKAVLPFIL